MTYLEREFEPTRVEWICALWRGSDLNPDWVQGYLYGLAAQSSTDAAFELWLLADIISKKQMMKLLEAA